MTVRVAFEQHSRSCEGHLGQYDRRFPQGNRIDAKAHLVRANHEGFAAPGRVAQTYVLDDQQWPGRETDMQIARDFDRSTKACAQVARKRAPQPVPLEQRDNDRNDSPHRHQTQKFSVLRRTFRAAHGTGAKGLVLRDWQSVGRSLT